MLSEHAEQPRRIGRPDEQVDVLVRPRDPSEQEVECPAALQPAFDPGASRERRELLDQLELPLLTLFGHRSLTFCSARLQFQGAADTSPMP
jgi:hypothetical protein